MGGGDIYIHTVPPNSGYAQALADRKLTVKDQLSANRVRLVHELAHGMLAQDHEARTFDRELCRSRNGAQQSVHRPPWRHVREGIFYDVVLGLEPHLLEPRLPDGKI